MITCWAGSLHSDHSSLPKQLIKVNQPLSMHLRGDNEFWTFVYWGRRRKKNLCHCLWYFSIFFFQNTSALVGIENRSQNLLYEIRFLPKLDNLH